jgi:hypothetical protein
MSERHPIDELFSRTLHDAEVTPPPAVWEGIVRERAKRRGGYRSLDHRRPPTQRHAPRLPHQVHAQRRVTGGWPALRDWLAGWLAGVAWLAGWLAGVALRGWLTALVVDHAGNV